jgi:hypothetical protein
MISGAVVFVLLMASGCQREGAAPPVVGPQAPGATVVAEEGASEQETGRPDSVEAPDANLPVELMLRFLPGQAATYKITTESYKSVAWLGSPSAKPERFQDGRRGNHVEMTLSQRVQEVRDDGSAVLEITIEALKYTGDFRDNVVLDFDSARPGEQNASLMALVGKRYTLEMSPKGQVLAVGDLELLRQAVLAAPGGRNAALRLIAEDKIRDRHTIVPLTILKEDLVRPGQTWSDVKTFSFGDMGPKSFERMYTLRQVQPGNGRIAVVEMTAIPPARGEPGQPKMGPMMVDASDEYGGRLELNLDSGQVREYVETMRTEWAIADPATMQGDTALAALKMGATWLHRVELVP